MKLFIVTLLVCLDFFSKRLIFDHLDLNTSIIIFSFFEITHIRNYGISFGLFANILPIWTILLLGILITIILFLWMLKSTNIVEKWGILLIISGAISNIGDRATHNYVLDFIYLHYKEYYWPAFNFADIYITIGVLLIIIQSLIIFKTRIKQNNV